MKTFAVLSILGTAGAARADDLIVFAAASLKGPLDEIAAQHPDVRVSYAGSGTLARQVQQGAPADVVLLASDVWMVALEEGGDVDAPVDFASNRLVLIGPDGAAPVPLEGRAIEVALAGGRLAMGFTASVPAGIYGQEALATLGLWETVAPHVAEVDNVRGAVALVARGVAPLGVVYATDARVVPGVTIVAVFPAESHSVISYQAAVVATSIHPEAAAFVAQLQEPEAQAILRAAGFCAVDAPCDVP